jgi:hypothetical protein
MTVMRAFGRGNPRTVEILHGRTPVKKLAVSLVVGVLSLGALGFTASAASAAPCPPGTEWDPIQGKCIEIGIGDPKP